jgi:uncharacterized protein (TIGR02145 family)
MKQNKKLFLLAALALFAGACGDDNDVQNYLDVNPAEFTLTGEATSDNRFTITTNVATGWTINTTDSPQDGGAAITWISDLSGSFSGAGNEDDATFSVSKNESDAERIGYIHVKAVDLDFAVKVTQHALLGIRIMDAGGLQDIQELVFSSAVDVRPDAQQFLLHWVPGEAQVSVSASTTGDIAFGYGPGSDEPGTTMTTINDPSGSGEKVFTIHPAALTAEEIAENPFVEKASRVSFEASYDSHSASIDIYLRQIHFNTVADVADNYKLDGEEHSFTVRSNAGWVISAVSDPQGILQADPPLLGLSGGNSTSCDTVYFKLITSGEATLILTDPAGRAEDVRVTIQGVGCGIGGNAVSMRIGNHDYLTHMYGTKCWMVENSKEGTPSSIAYGRDANGNPLGTIFSGAGGAGLVNGYYYARELAPTACPEGWRLPTITEVADLVSIVKADIAGIGRWWAVAGEKASGYFYTGYFRWEHWGDNSVWWAASGQRFLGYATDIYIINSLNANWLTVRCVQD